MATWTQRTIGNSVVESITAGKITSGTLDVSTFINVGDPSLPHLSLGGTALRVFRPDSDGGLQTSVQLGGADRDVIQITDPDTGSTLAALHDDGRVTGQSVATHTLEVGGQKLGDPHDPDGILWMFSRGASGYMMPHTPIATSPTAGGTQMGAFEVAAEVQGGRQYRVDAALQLHLPDDGLPTSYAKLVYTLDGKAPVVGSTLMQMTSVNWPATSGITQQVNVVGVFTPGLDPALWYTARILVVFWRRHTASVSRGTIKVLSAATNPSLVTVQDIGPVGAGFMAEGALNSGGGVPPTQDVVVVPPPPKPTRTYTTTWGASWGRSYYLNDNRPRNDVGNDLYQGYFSYPNASMIGFPPAMVDAITGSKISKIEVYLYAFHWWDSRGGTAFLGVHGEASQPAGFSSSGSHTSGGWGRGEGRWVTVPSSWHAAFETGVNKGITLGANAGTDRRNYSKFYGHTHRNNPKIRITYTK